MGRIRTVKPELLIHEGLQELEIKAKLPVMLVFIGLLTQADREGRFRWKPRILKLAILPFMPFDMETAMNGLHGEGYIRKYEIDGEPYGDIPTFSDHQVVNAHEKKSEYPAYEDAYACMCITSEGTTKHVRARGEGKGKEGKRKGNGKAPSDAGAEASPVFISIPLVGDGEHSVTEEDVLGLSGLFPAVDVRQALREVLAWNNTNPTRRKTASGVEDHIRRWLAKIQNEGGNRGAQPSSAGGREVASPASQRVASGVNAFRQAGERFGLTATSGANGADGSPLSPPGHRAGSGELPVRHAALTGEVRIPGSGDGASDLAHKAGPEILPPSVGSSGGVRGYGN